MLAIEEFDLAVPNDPTTFWADVLPWLFGIAYATVIPSMLVLIWLLFRNPRSNHARH